jgi:O-antigen ligase
MPFTSAFCISSSLSWPLIWGSISTIFILVYLLAGNKIHSLNIKSLYIILLFLLNVALSFFINDVLNPPDSFVFEKTVNHLFAYFASFINFYVTTFLLFNLNSATVSPNQTIKIINWVLFFSCVFAIIEFTAKNVFSIDFDQIVPHPAVEKMNALALSDIFKSIRARGLSEEPGHFAFMINLFSPLTIYYLFFSKRCYFSKWAKIGFVIVLIIALILTFSTAAFVVLPISLFISFVFFRKFLANHLIKIFTTAGLLVMFALAIDNYVPLITQLALDIDQKTSNSGSMDDRTNRSELFKSYYGNAPVLNKIIGYGPSGYLKAGLEVGSESFLVLYQTFLFETGIIGMFIYVGFLIFILFQIKKIVFPLSFFLFFSFTMGILHYFFISNYWYPWYWFICAFISYISNLPQFSIDKS